MLADLQSNLVNTEPRGIKRKTPHPRNAVYMAMLDKICTDNEAIPGILAAFNAALDIDPVKKQRLHRSNLPTKPCVTALVDVTMLRISHVGFSVVGIKLPLSLQPRLSLFSFVF